MASKERVSAALDIMRRMPPSRIEQSLAGIINLSPDDTEELLQRVDQPLQEQMDEISHKKYIICDYNRDGDSYRSPWSNKYDPPLEDGLTPVAALRSLEVEANKTLALYAQRSDGTIAVHISSPSARVFDNLVPPHFLFS